MTIYPITRVFGPALSELLCGQISAVAASLLNLEAEWESRVAGTEADLLGMRILVAAGFDPRVMLRVWGEDGVFHRIERKRGRDMNRYFEGAEDLATGDGKTWLDKHILVRDHPLSDERYARVKRELELWQRRDGEVSGESPGDFLD